jgi:hypothetical protein
MKMNQTVAVKLCLMPNNNRLGECKEDGLNGVGTQNPVASKGES